MPEPDQRKATLEAFREAIGDRYAVQSVIGSGGMATVFRARDERHRRDVAIKVLDPGLAASIGSERFLHEIVTAANLSHPHILPLHDSGDADGFVYYVMPVVEGESLRERLEREQKLPVPDAIQIACEVADALAYAHERGVLHRDVKPANILLERGHALLADFGIAKALSDRDDQFTRTGTSLGTPKYMSPEQIGADRPVDGRSDLYSLACVLYEMLAGVPPHTAATTTGLYGAILTQEPAPIERLRKTTPPHVASALYAALQKEPADRPKGAADFVAALKDPSGAPAGGRTNAKTARRLGARFWGAVVGATAIGLLAWFIGSRRASGPTAYEIGLPSDASILPELWTQFDIVPDGSSVVYIGSTGAGESHLWRRTLQGSESERLRGSEGAAAVAVSPDGTQVAFMTDDGLLKVVPVSGGDPVTIHEFRVPRGFRWMSENALLLGDGQVRFIGAQGDPIASHPVFCPLPTLLSERNAVLCGAGPARLWAVVHGLSDSTSKVLQPMLPTGGLGRSLVGEDFRVIDGRFVTFMSPNGELRAASFDPLTLDVGRPTTILRGVRKETGTGAGQYAVSRNGTLVYAEGPHGESGRLMGVALGRRPEPILEEWDVFRRFDISPDESKLAAVVAGVNAQQLRVYNLQTGSYHVLLEHEFVGEPLWSSDGRRILVSYGSLMDPTPENWRTRAIPPDGGVAPEVLFDGQLIQLLGHHADSFVVGLDQQTTFPLRPVVVIIDTTQDPPTMDSIFNGAMFPMVSPNREWMSVLRGGLFVAPYDEPTNLRRVPRPGGDNASGPWGEAQWASSNELVFTECCTTWYRVEIPSDVTSPIGTPEVIHSDRWVNDTPGQSFRLARSGNLYYLQRPEARPITHLQVVPNWLDRLEEAVAEANR